MTIIIHGTFSIFKYSERLREKSVWFKIMNILGEFPMFPIPFSDIGYPVYSDQSVRAYSVRWFILVQVKPQRRAFFFASFIICLYTVKEPVSEV